MRGRERGREKWRERERNGESGGEREGKNDGEMERWREKEMERERWRERERDEEREGWRERERDGQQRRQGAREAGSKGGRQLRTAGTTCTFPHAPGPAPHAPGLALALTCADGAECGAADCRRVEERGRVLADRLTHGVSHRVEHGNRVTCVGGAWGGARRGDGISCTGSGGAGGAGRHMAMHRVSSPWGRQMRKAWLTGPWRGCRRRSRAAFRTPVCAVRGGGSWGARDPIPI